MASLNEIAERIAYAKNQPLNTMLRENLKFSIKYWRAMLIRRDIERNGLSDEFLQRIYIPLTKVDKADACNFAIGCDKILRTTNKVPKPIRVKSDVLFKYVGTADGKAFTYIEYEELFYREFNRFTSRTIAYTYINEFLYFFNNNKLKQVMVQSPFSNPSEVNIACEGCYNDDMTFPIADDMIEAIVRGILSGEFATQIPPATEEVDLQAAPAIIK